MRCQGKKIDNVMIMPTGEIVVVQSCDVDWANIGMFAQGLNAYYHVSVPDLVHACRRVYPGELSGEVFDQVLGQNRDKVLQTIRALNDC